ncbi:sulfotransferase family protein [Kibdelosporangium philippinense]|uniref:Sulfotransferase family protein n=2 Tax=Kibdelosporangium philippinense TaxID=211113 RepID=A0ABS8Z7C6_9PSEU|nr:sulfotransferase family protein [Kibdelosporangium philippinense]MCE7003784.1 sulfotransferase family protein [Kibdelosporangium philippinense]
MVEIIGAGFGRTGTASLKRAVELLGFDPCHHMSEVLKQPSTTVQWTTALNGDPSVLPELLRDYRATLDFPGCLLWREMMDLYPSAKVLLSVRDPKKWYDSARATILSPIRNENIDQNLAALLAPFSEAMASRGFRRDLAEADMIAVFNKHNETVRAAVDPSRLLVYEVSEGWEPLCAFLGVEVPDVPFPRSNDSASFRDNVTKIISGRAQDMAT